MPVHLITAEQSHFYKQGLPQGMKKIYGIEFSVVEGGHMFPLEQPESISQSVKKIISAQQNIECIVKNPYVYSSRTIKL